MNDSRARWTMFGRLASTLVVTGLLVNCQGFGDRYTYVVLRNDDSKAYLLKTAERGADDVPVTSMLAARQSGSLVLGSIWRGTVRLIDRQTCQELDVLEIDDADVSVVVRQGAYANVSKDLQPEDLNLAELPEVDACR